MTDHEFDEALISSAFRLAAERGWSDVTVAAAATRADLPLDRARARFPATPVILMRFGRLADMAALVVAHGDTVLSPPRDRLFDVVMRRIDVLEAHRDGVLALFRALPTMPLTAATLGAATLGSMAWLLEASGISVTGVRGALRVKGMVAVWAYTVRAWQKDASEDLSATLAALDRALDRAEQAEATLYRGRAPVAPPDGPTDADFVSDEPGSAPI